MVNLDMAGFMGSSFSVYEELAAVENIPCTERTPVIWCAVEGASENGVTEMQKCQQMAALLNSESDELSFSCVERSDCHSTALADGHAHLVSLDGGDLFETSKAFGAVPIMAETYEGTPRHVF